VGNKRKCRLNLKKKKKRKKNDFGIVSLFRTVKSIGIL
jgi:hypothetical protein